MEGFIKKRLLCFERAEKQLLFYYRHENSYRLFFYAAQTSKLVLNSFDLPVFTAYQYYKGRENAAMNTFLLNSGFSEYRLSGNMSMAVSESVFDNLRTNKVEYGTRDRGDEIIRLWRGSLDVYTSDIPDSKHLAEMIALGQILVIIEDNAVRSVCHIRQEENRIRVRLVATDKEYRRRGYCQSFFHFICRGLAAGENTRVELWVDVNNKPAVEAYLKFGMKFNGRLSKYYVYGENGLTQKGYNNI